MAQHIVGELQENQPLVDGFLDMDPKEIKQSRMKEHQCQSSIGCTNGHNFVMYLIVRRV